jgi:predicted ABC-type ATPase
VIAALDARPIVIALAGPNGAGKTTFFHAHLQPAALRFVNADDLARELDVDAYEGARLAQELRQVLVDQRESFVFETVFSDPAGAKLDFLRRAEAVGYEVILCFIGVDGPTECEQRVAMRVLQGGHDVPTEKLLARFPRTLRNLATAIRELPRVLVYDNGDLGHPFRQVAEFQRGTPVLLNPPLPAWLEWK